ncbi:MAG: NifB/NifX family molybdenum-iron cluster-binding protein [Promethearchaeota archaeon]
MNEEVGNKMKKFAISTENNEVCPHFGHAPEFTFVTIENDKVVERKVISSPAHAVGTIPKFVSEQGATYVITGGAGPMAVDLFRQFGIEVIMGVGGSIDSVIKEVLDGTLKGGQSLCTHE